MSFSPTLTIFPRDKTRLWEKKRNNIRSLEICILVGFSDYSALELILFMISLTFYLFPLLGNINIFLLSTLNFQFLKPMLCQGVTFSLLEVCLTIGSIHSMLYSRIWGADKGHNLSRFAIKHWKRWNVFTWLSRHMTSKLQSGKPCTKWHHVLTNLVMVILDPRSRCCTTV